MSPGHLEIKLTEALRARARSAALQRERFEHAITVARDGGAIRALAEEISSQLDEHALHLVGETAEKMLRGLIAKADVQPTTNGGN